MTSSTTPARTGRRRINWRLALVSLGIAIGLVMIVYAFLSAETGREALGIPDAIEDISPAPGDEVLRQSQIVVDLPEGYEGALVVNGIELPVTRLDELTSGGAAPQPGEQVEIPPTAIFDPGNATLTFQPQEGAPIEEFRPASTVTATILYWPAEEGRTAAKRFTWQFDVV